jgi:hypothetical protein
MWREVEHTSALLSREPSCLRSNVLQLIEPTLHRELAHERCQEVCTAIKHHPLGDASLLQQFGRCRVSVLLHGLPKEVGQEHSVPSHCLDAVWQAKALGKCKQCLQRRSPVVMHQCCSPKARTEEDITVQNLLRSCCCTNWGLQLL